MNSVQERRKDNKTTKSIYMYVYAILFRQPAVRNGNEVAIGPAGSTYLKYRKPHACAF